MYYEAGSLFDKEVDLFKEDVEMLNCVITSLQNEVPMYTETESQRNYLKNRLYTVFEEKDRELGRKYGVEDDVYPQTWGELIDRIAKGRYVLPQENKDDSYEHHSLLDINYMIRWRDPDLKADKEGYKIVKNKMREAKQAALDKISILDPKEGLNVLNEFEKATFH
jgi:hypothetical protein